MPKALHKNKWRNISSIEKCDNGFNYQLEGISGKVYHDSIEDLDLSKQEQHEIVNPDGSITRGPGKEPLRKPLRKSISQRWKLLKAQISHEMAFMPAVEDEDEHKDKQLPTGDEPVPEQAGGDQVTDDDNTAKATGGQEIDQDSTAQSIEDPDAEDNSDAVDISSLSNKEGEGEKYETNVGDDVDAEEAEGDEGQDVDSYDEEKLIELLRQDGYSDSEIAYIIHSHAPNGGSHEARAFDIDQQREQEKHDHHMDRMKGQTSVQADHAQRMADLEYEHAKKEKELRIKHLEEELKTKLQHLKNKGREDGKAN